MTSINFATRTIGYQILMLATKIIGIGASAGGLEAIVALLHQLPAHLQAAILVVIHRAPDLPSYLKDVLERNSALPVKLATEGTSVQAGTCFVSLPNCHMMLTPDYKLHLVADGFYRGNNIDLFHSLARCAGHNAIGVLLSGLLKDGAVGLRAIKEAGGTTLVQSPAEATFPDMPINAIRSDGPIDFVGDVHQLALEIAHRCIQHAQTPTAAPG